MLSRIRFLLSDADLGGCGRFNRAPLIEHGGTCLDTEIARMRATATAVSDVPVYTSFWLYGPPADIKHPLVLSRTWIREIPGPQHDVHQYRVYAATAGRPFVNSSLYWLTVFQRVEAEKAVVVSDPRAYFPYCNQQNGCGFRCA